MTRASGESEDVAPEVLRLGGLAQLDPDPDRELGMWRDDLARGAVDDPVETRERLDRHARGDAMIVRLSLFADVAEGDTLRRIDGIRVPGLWFERGRDGENARHAAEIVADRLELIRDDLSQHGVAIATEQLAELPVKIELDADLSRALSPGI